MAAVLHTFSYAFLEEYIRNMTQIWLKRVPKGYILQYVIISSGNGVSPVWRPAITTAILVL